MTDAETSIAPCLEETGRKVEASLLPAIEEHVTCDEFSTKQGLDFLDTKNSLLLSYLIDLTLNLRNTLTGEADAPNMERLLEMRTVLDKTRNLDKKLRYQIDKLLTAQTNASSFAAGDTGSEDPLQFRPRVDSMDKADNNADQNASDDDDLDSARETIRAAKEGDDEDESSVYRAPRVSAVPYTHDKEDRMAEKEKRQRRRMRASELAKTLRSQYGDTPEQEDIHGGSEVGKQGNAARRMAEREAEKTSFEEDQMVRLTTTRKEKKEKQRLMRAENSNLGAISDLGNLVRESTFGNDKGRFGDDDSDEGEVMSEGRHANGRRKRQMLDNDGRVMEQKRKKGPMKSKNAFQAALFDNGGSGGGSGGARPKKLKKNKKSY